jgi:hypothetical protein
MSLHALTHAQPAGRQRLRFTLAALACAAAIAGLGAGAPALGGDGDGPVGTALANTEPLGGAPAPTSEPILTATLT